MAAFEFLKLQDNHEQKAARERLGKFNAILDGRSKCLFDFATKNNVPFSVSLIKSGKLGFIISVLEPHPNPEVLVNHLNHYKFSSNAIRTPRGDEGWYYAPKPGGGPLSLTKLANASPIKTETLDYFIDEIVRGTFRRVGNLS
jgi:hypothetical protein